MCLAHDHKLVLCLAGCLSCDDLQGLHDINELIEGSGTVSNITDSMLEVKCSMSVNSITSPTSSCLPLRT